MKVLTLTQPWATLVAIGAKHIETRSWPTKYRGPLAIHAAQGLGPVGGMRGFVELIGAPLFQRSLAPDAKGGGFWETVKDRAAVLPRGAILAVCELETCIPTLWLTATGRTTVSTRSGPAEYVLTDQERAFGDYTPGRYAWLLSNVRALPEPIPAKGALGLWNWDETIEV